MIGMTGQQIEDLESRIEELERRIKRLECGCTNWSRVRPMFKWEEFDGKK